MIERLQRRFILIAMVSLMMIMLIIIGAINAVNMYHMDRVTDGALYLISENEGRFPEFDRAGRPIPVIAGFDFQITPESRYETRFFIVNFNDNGEVISVDASNIAAIGQEDAIEYAEEIAAGKQTKGYRDNYKYRIFSKPYGTMMVILDCRNYLLSSMMLLQISLAIAFLSLVLMFILVSILSKRAMKPAQISLEKQKQFITDAGHEIKTPLAVISSNADVLELTHGENQWVASIRNQITRLDDLVKKLLALSKIEENPSSQEYNKTDLGRLINDAITEFQPMADEKGQVIISDLPPNIIFNGNESEMRQMVMILIDNAIKYAAADGDIRIKLFGQGKRIVLEMHNSIMEPPTDDPDRLFDRFFRADSSRSRESGGYGIGLSIARAIAQTHKGDIIATYENNMRVICFRVQLSK